MKRAGVRVYEAAEVPFLLAFGVPALLMGCVIGGVCVLVALLCRQKAKKASVTAGQDTPEDDAPEEQKQSKK